MLGQVVLAIGPSVVGVCIGYPLISMAIGVFFTVGIGGFFLWRSRWVGCQRMAWIDEAHVYLGKRIDAGTYPDDAAAYYDVFGGYDRMLYRRPWVWDCERLVCDWRRYAEVKGWGPEQ